MQYLAICEDDLLFHFMRNVASKQAEVLFLVQDAAVAKRIKRQGGKVRQGDLLKEDTIRESSFIMLIKRSYSFARWILKIGFAGF
jgi:hypothetical protein